MDPTQRVVGLNPQTNMVFTVVKPVMGILQVSAPESSLLQSNGPIPLHQDPNQVPNLTSNLAPNLIPNMVSEVQPPTHLTSQTTGTTETHRDPGPELGLGQDPSQDFGAGDSGQCSVEHLPFAEVASLLDPNMKGSKARKHLISYEEIRRRLQPPEKMSLRSIAAYTRVSRGPASKNTLQQSLSVLGLKPSTTTAVSSSFSKLTEGDTRALCDDMRDFSQDYIDYENVAKQLIPKVNTVQHWSKIIETKNHLEDMRRVLQESVNSQSFDSATHGLGLGMIHVVLDLISTVIQHQVRILSGSAGANSDLTNETCTETQRKNRKRQRKFNQNTQHQRTAREAAREGAREEGREEGREGKRRRKPRQEEEQTMVEAAAVPEQQIEGSNMLLLTVGYEAVSGEIHTNPSDNNEPVHN